ncbi:hypothetical protein ACH35V_02200 [Actinomadura sp. 1N219]|uniref:hypothetical protein n=1 Tax=Actinomadura sp. 1N219 TaxID=3375152 RepID=UPI003797A84A
MSAPRYVRDLRTDEQIRAAAAAEMQRRFGVLAWFGGFTGLYWALVDKRQLVAATTPQALGEQIKSARQPR